MEENTVQQPLKANEKTTFESQETPSTKTIDINRVSGAFMIIFMGCFISQIPIDTWSIKIMWITAWIAILAGSIQLFKILNGSARKASLLWIGATLFCILSIPFDIMHSFTQGIIAISKETGNGQHTGDFETLNSFFKWFSTLGSLMYIGGIVLFMTNSFFARYKFGWISLLLAFAMYAFRLHSLFIQIPLFIGFYLIITQLYAENDLSKRRAEAFIWMATGLLYSLLILLNNDTVYIITSLVGLIAWLIGVVKVRSLGYENQGSSAFLAYAILMFLASVLHLLPGLVGDGLAILLQVPAYIALGIGFTRFGNSKVFSKRENGMNTMSGILYLCMILAFIYLIPFVGESISAMIFSTLCIPCIIIGWKNALTSTQNKTIDLSYQTEPTSINWKSIFVKHKKISISIIILLILSLAAGNINLDKYAENWLSRASMLASEAGHMAEITNTENFEINQLVKKAARLGNYEAKLYRGGLTVRDLQNIYNKAKGGNSYAQYAVGFLFRFSSPILNKMKDGESEKAQKWLQENKAFSELEQYHWFNAAAEQGHPRAQYLIDNAYQKEKEESHLFEQYLKSANEGNAGAQNAVGDCYSKGKGTEWDKSEAIKWWRKAAQNGNAKAQVHMGNAYERRYYHDDTTPYNREEAVKWYKMAAAQNNAEALYEMAKHTKDRKEATQWMKKAAEQGYGRAIDEVKHMRY